jgi:hypothetical protein
LNQSQNDTAIEQTGNLNSLERYESTNLSLARRSVTFAKKAVLAPRQGESAKGQTEVSRQQRPGGCAWIAREFVRSYWIIRPSAAILSLKDLSFGRHPDSVAH